MEQQAPDLIRVQEIGSSVQGRPIYAVQVGNGKDALYIDAAHHGNEIITPMVALYFLKYLVEHRSEPEISGLLSTRVVYIIPCVNPDGYTARQRVNANGVDPNRNYSEAWRPSNADEDDSISPGQEPFSEPETRAVRDFIGAHPDIKIALTLHSGIDRIHYCRPNFDKPSIQDYSIYTRLSEEGRLRTANLGCGPAGVSPLTVAPTGGGRGTTLSWLHSKGLYAFTVECYGDGVYPWVVGEKYYPPEAHILDICKRWVPFEMFMLKAVSRLAGEPVSRITEIYRRGVRDD
ncbi:MAG: hypothetical protein HY762_04895 [Planctomycetes bacterium]|nr:hypothetical protein [Planctomycetota bacterium]